MNASRQHGGGPEAGLSAPGRAAAAGGRPAADLSMNETPYPPLPSVRRLTEAGAGHLNRYPDHRAGPLVSALARRLRVPEDEVVVGPGSAGLCQHIIQALGPGRSEVVHAALSFEAYPLIIANAGARPVPVPLAGYQHDLDSMAAAVTAETRCVLLCNPNNPTGAVAHRTEVEEFLGRIPGDVVVIIDEAYRDFVTDPDVPDGLDLYRARRNVCVLRTFSKAYGLAALRVGFAVAAPAIAAAARRVGMVFFPGSLGQAAAIASLEPAAEAELAARCAELAGERRRLRDTLRDAGFAVAPSQANFLWLPLGDDAERFAARCRDGGVLVRAYPGMGVRITIGTAAANDRVCAIARQLQAARRAPGPAGARELPRSVLMTELPEPIPYPFADSPSIYEPAAIFAELRRDRPAVQVTMADGTLAWLVTRYGDVRQVLVDPRFSRAAASGPGAPRNELGALVAESLIGMDPPEHTRLRKIVAYAFTPRRVEQLRPRVARLVSELLGAMQMLPQPADLVEHFSTPLPIQVIGELFGVPEADRELCKVWSDTMMGDWERDPEGTQAALDGFAGLIAARRATPTDDLISALIAASDEQGKLSERDLLMVCIGILIGGHETTTNQVNLFVLTLLHNPGQLAALAASPELIPSAVEELIRVTQFGDTGVMLPRITTEEVVLGGVTIPAGAPVLAAFVAANRDPAVFDDPDRLDLARRRNAHLGFGAGAHHCLGAQLARMELQEALRGLLSRMPRLQVAVPESQLRFKAGLVVRSLEALPITW